MSLETPITDVNAEASSTSETAVNEQTAETTATETTATTETIEQTQGESQETTQTANVTQVPINSELYDERGIPWKNRALEFQRKFDETQTNLPKLIAEEVAKISQPQQKKYSIAELEQFAQANPEHRAWVEEEKAKVLKDSLSREFDQRIEATAKAQRDESVKRETFNHVLSRFPDLAIRDQQGNFLGWNNVNPMTQAVGKYMSSPDLAGRPDGLLVAAKLAYADIAMQKLPDTNKTIRTLKNQVRKAQAGTMLEGGGRKPGSENPVRKHIERFAASGNKADAVGAMKEIFKARGVIKE